MNRGRNKSDRGRMVIRLSPSFIDKVESLALKKHSAIDTQIVNTVREMYLARGWRLTSLASLTSGAARETGDSVWSITPCHKLAVAEFVDSAAEIKTAPFQALIDDNGDDFECITIVCRSGITANIKNVEKNTRGKVELFKAEDLKSNITLHELQPIFEKMDKQKAMEFKEKYGSGLSTMLKQDPIARFLRFQTGDVIKVSPRTDDIVGDIVYKIVK